MDELVGDAGAVTSEAPALALYRRYRPDTFAEMIGQDHVTGPLQRALENNRVNHAYLFSGPRGCGKTTSARILARALNCERGPAPEPCGACVSCVDLARGGPGSIDVIEIDAASHGGVDDARDLRERAFFAPVQSRFKIYIVDEAHMVTTAGFNALLKLVEEPPPHVKFIFATTEPDKVIGTIRSRTHHYPFRLVPPKTLSEYLSRLCVAEGVDVEQAVLPLVVRAGAGSVRDSLSVLDQLLGSADAAQVRYGQAAALLGYTPDSLLDEIVDAFAAGDGGAVFAGIDKVIEVGQDPRRFAEDLLNRLRDLLVVGHVPDAVSSGLIDVAGDQADRLRSQAAGLGAGELTRAAEVIARGLTEMRGTTAPRLHLELMCSRVLLPGADVDDRGVHARLDRLERRLGMDAVEGAPGSSGRESSSGHAGSPGSGHPEPSGRSVGASEPASSASSVPTPPHAQPPVAAADSASTPGAAVTPPPAPNSEPPAPNAETATASAQTPAATPARDPEPPAAAAPPEAPPRSDAETSASAALNTAEVRRLWPGVLEEAKSLHRYTWILLSQHAQVAEFRDGVLTLAMPNVGARDSFIKGRSVTVLPEALRRSLGVEARVDVMVDESATPTRGDGPQGGGPGRGPQSSDRGTNGPGGNAPPVAPVESATDSPVASDPSAAARSQIRPTRGADAAAEAPPEDEPDPADDPVGETDVSHRELLANHLGAALISEEPAKGC